MIRNTKDLFARQTQTWADCPDWIQAIVLDNICGTIRAMMDKEHGVRQDCLEGYINNCGGVATEPQSQASSPAT